jgi:molecular chaperone DnaK (HSP70)
LKQKKGFIITAIILAAITAGSFTIWIIPQTAQTKFIISDAKENLDEIIEQQKTVSDSTSEEFTRMLNGQITPDNYIDIAQISSSQINFFIIKIVQSDVPEEWRQSYSTYTDFLRAYNSYLQETMVIANKLKENSDITDDRARIDSMLNDANTIADASLKARP